MARNRGRRSERAREPQRVVAPAPEATPARFDRLPRKIAVALILVAAILPYLNTLGNGFVYDDHVLVEHDARVSGNQSPLEAFQGDMWREPGPGSKAYRPLFTLSLMLNHRVAGASPWLWHLVNVALHTLVCVLLFFLASEYFRRPVALLGTILFALHPIHTEAVAWVTARSELMMTLFVLASLWAGTRGMKSENGRMRWAIATLVFMTLALLSKETAIVTPALLLLLVLYWRKGRTTRQDWVALGLLFGAAVVYVLLRVALTGGLGAAREGQILSEYGAWRRLLLAGQLVLHYMGLLFYPIGLTVEYFYPKYPPDFAITMVGGLAGIIGLIGVVILLRKRFPGGWLALGWFLIALLPVLNLIPIGEVQAERFLYLPSVAFCLLIGAGLAGPWLANAFRWGFLAFLCLFYLTVTLIRNEDWKSDKTLWAAAVQVSDRSPLALRNHGDDLLLEQKPEEALEIYKKARELEPDNWEHYYRIGLANAQLGNYEDAVDAYRRALTFNDSEAGIYFNMGNALRDNGDSEGALEAYRKALELDPEHAETRYNLAHLLNTMNRTSAAEEQYRKLLEDHPDHISGRHNFANLLVREGHLEEGIAEYRQVLRREPGRVNTWQALSNALWDSGDRKGAVDALQKVLEIKPDAAVYSDLGYACYRMDDFQKARENYTVALRFDPEHVKTLWRMAVLCASEGKTDEGLNYLKRLLATDRVRPIDLMNDPELASLTRDSRFLEMAGLQ